MCMYKHVYALRQRATKMNLRGWVQESTERFKIYIGAPMPREVTKCTYGTPTCKTILDPPILYKKKLS
jgi:hypothetical protein